MGQHLLDMDHIQVTGLLHLQSTCGKSVVGKMRKLTNIRLPKRDWRDWFIMATVMGGVSFGLYVTAKVHVF
jgi:hypothetical protein